MHIYCHYSSKMIKKYHYDVRSTYTFSLSLSLSLAFVSFVCFSLKNRRPIAVHFPIVKRLLKKCKSGSFIVASTVRACVVVVALRAVSPRVLGFVHLPILPVAPVIIFPFLSLLLRLLPELLRVHVGRHHVSR